MMADDDSCGRILKDFIVADIFQLKVERVRECFAEGYGMKLCNSTQLTMTIVLPLLDIWRVKPIN